MGWVSARFFHHLQGADFYRDLHAQAVALLGPGQGRTWFDIGCGAGLVTHLAHAQGHVVTGFDPDEAMLNEARRDHAGEAGLRFLQSGLEGLADRHGRAHVVSAASLLMVLPDRRAALSQLLSLVAPGGTLLVVETSEAMARASPDVQFSSLAHGRRAWMLRLWARVRRHADVVNVAALCPPGCTVQRHELLGGLVHAWLVRPPTEAGTAADSPATPAPRRVAQP